MTTREIISSNLQLLLERRAWSPRKLATKSGVAQRTISKTIRLESSPTADTLERLADKLDVPVWQLMLPHFVGDLPLGRALEKLVEHYVKSSEDGRIYISRTAKREAEYEGTDKSTPSSDDDFTDATRM